MKTVVFDESAKEFVLEVFGKKLDDDNYVVEADSGSRVITPEGNFVKSEEFAAVVPGSEIFVTNDMPSLLKHVNREVLSGQAV